MADFREIALGSGLEARVCFTDASDGDFRVLEPAPGLEQRRRAIVDLPWTWIRQVHGSTVLRVDRPGHHAGAEADGLITTATGCPIAVTTADCAPLVLLAERGVGVVHAGWRGLAEGIIERAGEQLRSVAGRPVSALLGPCISPSAYEFGPRELAQVAQRFGSTVEGRTEDGQPALDVPAAVALACEQAGWPEPGRPPCTSDARWFSHRTRTDGGRQTVVAWLSDRED
ncbi:MAG: polyphenol oxidase family protein [Acidimicrobiales bacterium]